MATTTNYSWTTPDDTALVKDGASAIRTLGSSVDTTVKNLNPETTLGDLAYRSSTANVKTRLGLGTAGQVLQVNSGATAPEWATFTSGGMTLISETTASALSSLSLSSIPSTYKQLLLVWHGIETSDNSTFNVRLNNVSTNSYANSSWSVVSGFANNNSNLVSSVGGTALRLFGDNTTGVALYQTAMGYMIIDNYASTSKLKTYNVTNGYTNVSSGQHFGNILGTFDSASAITSIDIFRSAGTGTFSNKTNTTIRLYGVS